MQLFMPELISSSNHCPNLGTLHQKTHDTPPSPIHQRLILRLVVTTTAATPTPVTSPPCTAAAIIAAAVTAAATAPSSGVTWSRCTTGEACILQAKYVKEQRNSVAQCVSKTNWLEALQFTVHSSWWAIINDTRPENHRTHPQTMRR